jgi:NAD(P)-dependent dehydrogenase (short-subunit alcohol dehydrogenase family)
MTVLDAFSLAGKTAIVTGAGSSIGRAIAIAFAEAGASVGCADINVAAAQATCDAIACGRAVPLACDVSREADTVAAVKATVDAFGAARVLVNAAAAIDPTGTVLDLTRADWDRVFAVNVTGAFLMSRAALPAMIAAGGGSIIHIASQLGRVGVPARAIYCTTKGALIQLAKAMAIDHAPQNVRVNTLSPGGVETARLVFRHGTMETARQVLGPGHLVKRLGLPDEIARAALFLASDASSFVTGSDLLVDGGYTAV